MSNHPQETKDNKNHQIVVCDIGASTIKVGFASILTPIASIPCVVGYPSNVKSFKTKTKYPTVVTMTTPIKTIPAAEAPSPFTTTAMTVDGKNNNNNNINTTNDNKNYRRILIGDEVTKLAKHQQEHYTYEYPIDNNGMVQNWDALFMVLTYAFQTKLGLKIDDSEGDDDDSSASSSSTNYKLLLARPSFVDVNFAASQSSAQGSLKRLVQFLFDRLHLQAIHIHEPAALVLYTMGYKSGLIVDVGESMTRITPVCYGHALPHLNRQFPIGGRSLSLYLIQLLGLRGYHILGSRDKDIENVRTLKEKYCYAAIEWEDETHLADATTVLDVECSTSDGTIVTMGKERFQTVEAMFFPELLHEECSGLADMIVDTIQEAPIHCRTELSKHILLSGGTTLFPGFCRRLENDIQERHRKQDLDERKNEKKKEEASGFGRAVNVGGREEVGGELNEKWNLGIHSVPARGHLIFEGASLLADYIGEEENDHWFHQYQLELDGIESLLKSCGHHHGYYL